MDDTTQNRTLLEMLTRPSRRKRGHRNPHILKRERVRLRVRRGYAGQSRGHRHRSLSNRSFVDVANRQAQQDAVDAERQVDFALSVLVDGKPAVTSARNRKAAIQKRTRQLTEQRQARVHTGSDRFTPPRARRKTKRLS